MPDFNNKKVLIFGLGLNQGGLGSAKFFANAGAKVRVTDLKSEDVLKPSIYQLKAFKNIEYTLGEHKNEDFDWADLIIKNPAVKDNNLYLQYAQNKGKQIETDLSIFLEYANQKKLIAITGTKGKSTTAYLIYKAIKASGQNVLLAGNIGKSILDVIPYLDNNPWVVVEISSFQLQALKDKIFAPHIAVITNIYPDHLNWHSSMDEYIEAKKMIAINQTSHDYLVVGCHVDEKITEGIKSQIEQSCGEGFTEEFSIYYPNLDSLPLKGLANQDNYTAAVTVCSILKITPGECFKAFEKFKGAEFRMQELGEFGEIKIINDSTATNPISTIEAIIALGPDILIAGGMNKGLEYYKLVEAIETGDIKSVFFLEGDATEEIKKLIKNRDLIAGTYNDIEKLLTDMKKVIKKGDTILFSPGATSFNLFQNEFDRGRQFNKAVEKVFGEVIS